MSTYYNYYLEQKVPEGWQILKKIEKDISGEVGDKMLYWHTGSYGSNFTDHYFLQNIPFEEYCKEMKEEYRDSYEKVKSGSS